MSLAETAFKGKDEKYFFVNLAIHPSECFLHITFGRREHVQISVIAEKSISEHARLELVVLGYGVPGMTEQAGTSYLVFA